MVVNYSVKGDVFAPEKPRRWSALQLADVSPNWNFELGVDGKRFAAILNQADGTREHERAVHVTFLLNFIDEIRRRIPGRN